MTCVRTLLSELTAQVQVNIHTDTLNESGALSWSGRDFALRRPRAAAALS